MYKIYIVEDDTKIAHMLQKKLEQYGYIIELVKDFKHITEECKVLAPHMVLLDINLPYFDGYYWCRQIRKNHNIPIIFISARDGEMEQVMAIENGGDDYITKPVQLDLMIAKVRSQLRRAYGEYANVSQANTDVMTELGQIEVQGIELVISKHELSYKGITVVLTRNELLLAECFLKRYGMVVTRDQLLEVLWDDVQFVDDNTLTVNMTRLRKKFSELGLDSVIETVRGRGYKFYLN